jgi:uncharacterized protein (DUF1778 family)
MAKPLKKRRKPESERKENGITVWFTGADEALVKRAAAKAGDPVTHWMRKVIVKAAKAEAEE